MVLDCPHCHLRVGVNRDGICPNCNGNVHDLTGVDPTKSTLIVGPSAKHPEMCSQCGRATTRRVKVISDNAISTHGEESMSLGDRLGFRFLLGQIIPFAGLIAPGESATTSHTRSRLAVSVPQCKLCSGEPIRPIEAWHEQRLMKLLVDNGFKTSFDELNARV